MPTQTGHAFTLHLRLPGQMFDPETGLHYNRQRYYDPALGQYLTPDPLGTPDGPNPYAYVAFNPLGFVDPDGLVLFAFDGTGNSEDKSDRAMAGNGISNVVKFRDVYNDSGMQKRYVSGVGTVHKDTKENGGNIVPDDYANNTLIDWLTWDTPLFYNDIGGNYSGPARIDRMMLYMRDEAISFYETHKDTKAMDIDIVGFSRGAAQARDFANRITQASTTVNGKTFYKYKDKAGKEVCQWVNFRFMGLWDTVLSTNRSGYQYNLGIPSQFKHVSQAVALNEYRSGGISALDDSANIVASWALRNSAADPVDGKNYKQHMGGFPLVSIGASSSTPGATRIEMGFLGAHADIGGGYPESESQLSLVALNWMVKQAQTAGVNMDVSKLSALPTGSAVLHDQSNAIRVGDPITNSSVPTIVPLVNLATEDRTVVNATSGATQRAMGFGSGSKSMTNADTTKFITYSPRDPKNWGDDGPKSLKNITGQVDLQEYLKWLQADQRYQFVSQSK